MSPGRAREAWSLFARNRLGLVGLGFIVAFGLMAVLHPVLMNTVWDPRVYDPVTGYAFDATSQPAPPSPRHLLGTDPLGRDVLSQLMFSARAEFLLGLVAALVTALVGTVVGAVAAYFRGPADALLMRLADIIVMMPTLSLLVVLGALFELDLFSLALAIGLIAGFGGTAIVMKSQALAITVKPYMEAARLSGGGHAHVLRVHVLPNLLPLASLYLMFTVTGAVFSEAVLSFFGILDVEMSWGLMLHTAQSRGYLLSGTRFWWLLMPAGVSVTLLCGSFYLVGRALEEVVHPGLRRE